MKPPRYLSIAATAGAGLLLLPVCAALSAGEMKMELDTAANIRLFDTHFARYGLQPAKTITRDAKGVVRIRLPGDTKDVPQTGLYSYVVLAGDFEVSAAFDWTSVEAPRGGYGVSCGIAVDAGGGKEQLSLARGYLEDKGPGYLVTFGKPADAETNEMQWDTKHFPTKATLGRLVIRREKDELVCLAADGPKGEPRELHRQPFTTATVRQVRLFADAGGSPTAMDVRLSRLRVRAEEITGGFPTAEKPRQIPWWLIVALGFAGVAVALFLVRRRLQAI
jgi:hypothetical protein